MNGGRLRPTGFRAASFHAEPNVQVLVLTCCSTTAASHTDSASSPPETPGPPAAAEESPGRRTAVAPGAFRSSCEAPPPPSEHRGTERDANRRMRRRKAKVPYVLLSKQVLHLLLPGLTESVRLQGGEAVIDGEVHLRHSEEKRWSLSGWLSQQNHEPQWDPDHHEAAAKTDRF